MSHPFHIYRSSAGSGKTFTLSREYLRLALQKPQGFREILGVTFTNKATEEMKSRIVEILEDLAAGKSHPMQGYLLDSLGIDKSTLQKRSQEALTDILHQYGRFAIVTIDSFFHQVIRSFAKEMGLQGTFSIDLNLTAVIDRVVDNLLLDVGVDDKKELRQWLTEYAETRVEEGATWDFRSDIKKLASETLKEEFKAHSEAIKNLSDQPEIFTNVKKQLTRDIQVFKQEVVRICAEAQTILQSNGIDPSLYKGGSTQSPAWIFYRIVDKGYEITKTQQTKYGQPESWIKAKDPNEGILSLGLSKGLTKLYDELIDYINQNIIAYNSAVEAFRYLYTFGILTEINRYLEKYRDENDVMLIADLPDFLNQIINDSDTPYIYEKVGSRFGHYLIDEFQDTSNFQWNNFKPLVKNAADQDEFSMVVGDVKQSIYRFRGGDWDLLQSKVRADIGGGFADQVVKEENLTVNWRSDPEVIGFNNDLFKSALIKAKSFFVAGLDDIKDATIKESVEQLIDGTFDIYDDVEQFVPDHKKSLKSGAVKIELIAEEKDSEVKWRDVAVQKTIHEVEELQRLGYELRDIAILVRWNSEGRAIADAFVQFKNSEAADPKLKYDVISSEALFLTSSHVVRFLISLIKWLHDEANTVVLTEWYYEYRKYILKDAKEDSKIIADVHKWEMHVPPEFVSQKEFIKSLPVFELVEELIRVFQLTEYRDEITYIQGFQDAVLDYSKNERGDIVSFLEWWEEVRKDRAIQVSDENNAIKILTIHKSKGLEFPIVLIPFLHWSADHMSSGLGRDTILWCPGVEASPYDQLPILPLKYSKNLINTYWGAYYYRERLKVFVDNLNVLYVALTRPIHYLWISAPEVKQQKTISNINDLVVSALDEDGWSEDKATWVKGSIPIVNKKESTTNEYALGTYHSHFWRKKIAIKSQSVEGFDDSVFVEATLHGIRLHQLLSLIKYQEDLNEISIKEDREDLNRIVSHPDILPWFSKDWKVETEVPIVLPKGDLKRIDRVNSSDKETIIIDYKTGELREKDKRQVQEYMKIMREMHMPNVHGVLIYLQDLQIVKVNFSAK